MKRLRLQRRTWFMVVSLLIAGAAAWPLLSHPGLLSTRSGGDSPFLLQRLQQLTTALVDGHFPVRWMPDANYGYGYPFYNYYAPLSIYIAAGFRALGFGTIQALKLAQLLGFIVAAGGMFALGRRWLGSQWAGLLASAAYSLAPFHMVNVYVRGDSLAEFWAMAFYPLVLLSADYLLAGQRESAAGEHSNDNRPILTVAGLPKTRIALLAVTFAALILSHNISALIFTPFLLLFVTILALRRYLKGRGGPVNRQSIITPLTWVLSGLILALGLSAWFWIPALAESELVQLEPVTSGYFHYSNHFRGNDLVQGSLLFDYDAAGGRAFRMGLMQVLGITGGLAVLLATIRWRLGREGKASLPGTDRPRMVLFITAGLLITTIMMTPLSRPLWDGLPLLLFSQFPWRFLSVQALFGALATAGLALLPWRRVIVPAAIIALTVAALGNLQIDFLDITEPDMSAERLAEYEWYSGNIGSTVSAEYLPDTVRPRPSTSPWLNAGNRNNVIDLDGGLAIAELIKRQTTRQTWQMVAVSETTVILPALYYPGWKAQLDGRTLDVEPAPGSGLISIRVPEGDHQVTLRLARTRVRLAAEIASLVAAVIVAGLLLPKNIERPGRRFFGLLLLLLFLLVILRLLPQRSVVNDDLNWDFAQLAYLHHDVEVRFENGAELAAYRYDHDVVNAGETLLMTLDWKRAPAVNVTVALATPAINRHRQVPLLDSLTQLAAENETNYLFTIPANAPDGLYTPRVTIEGVRPLTPSGQTRSDLFLRPIRVQGLFRAAGGASPGNHPLDARAINISMPDRATLEVQMAWSTSNSLSHNYNYSLRLLDASGVEVAVQDGQPGYGFQPSSGWPAGEWVHDWLALPLPDKLPADPALSPLALVIRLYEVDTGEVVLTRRLGQLAWLNNTLMPTSGQPAFTLPVDIQPANIRFGQGIELSGYELAQDADQVALTLYWSALSSGAEDYVRFVHLVEPSSGEIVSQQDSMPQYNSYPTSQWMAGEIISDPVQLDLSLLPAGEYKLYTGLYHDAGPEAGHERYPRLAATNADGLPVPDNRYALPDVIVVEPR